ncbi:MAG: sugar ABC transporter permease [Micrococcales bacterium]|nr:sugar ABC transporter permease [Micrococcales bacterium]
MTTATITGRSVANATTATRPRELSRRPRRRENLAGWAFLAPFAIAFAAFLLIPMIIGLYLSLTDQSLAGAGGVFVGLQNYAEALTDGDMWRSLGNTAWFTLISTIPLVALALIMAVLVEQGIPGQWLWRLSYFMPFLLASTVVSQIWIWIFNPQLGAANGLLTSLGLAPVSWLQDPNTAMWSIVIATVWWTVGFNFLLYLAAIQNIPAQTYEAAALDGASTWRQVWSITLPQLAPTTVLVVMLQILASLKLFDQVYQMTLGTGGPGGAVRSIVEYIYDSGFTGYRLGYSAAISYVFFAIVVIVSIAQFRVTRAASRRNG